MMKCRGRTLGRIMNGEDENDLAEHLLEHVTKSLEGQDEYGQSGFVNASTTFPLGRPLNEESSLFGRHCDAGLPQKVSGHELAESRKYPVVDKRDRDQSSGASQKTVEDDKVEVSLGWDVGVSNFVSGGIARVHGFFVATFVINSFANLVCTMTGFPTKSALKFTTKWSGFGSWYCECRLGLPCR